MGGVGDGVIVSVGIGLGVMVLIITSPVGLLVSYGSILVSLHPANKKVRTTAIKINFFIMPSMGTVNRQSYRVRGYLPIPCFLIYIAPIIRLYGERKTIHEFP